jgi:DNA-binding MarR family transcriptional regulator
MKGFNDLNKAFENRIRLGIMSMLMVEETIEFNAFKSALELTDGNLASHIKSLEAMEYIQYEKSFFEKKPLTRYRATPLGKSEFMKHLAALEKLLKDIR